MPAALGREPSRRSCTICVRRYVTAFVAFALPTALWGCLAFQSDDFRIISAASDASDAGADGGSHAIEISDAASDTSSDGPGVRPDVVAEGPTDTQAEAPFDSSWTADAAPRGDATPDAQSLDADAAVDTGPADATPDAFPESAADGCSTIAPTHFGCGPPIDVQLPGQYCIDQWLTGSPTPPIPGEPAAVAVTMPAACQCVETYNCACLMAITAGQALCRVGVYVTCSIGTTGGVVVVCR